VADLSPQKAQIYPCKRIGPMRSIKEVWHSGEIWYSYKDHVARGAIRHKLGCVWMVFGQGFLD
jgi:hypothetical protein